MRTRERNKDPFLGEQLQSPQMDFLIAPPGASQRIFRLGKGWRIQNNEIEPRFSFRQAGQVIKDIGSDGSQMDAVPLRALLNSADQVAIYLDCSDGFSAGSRAGQREGTLIRKAVQDNQPARDPRDLAIIINLVEIKAGLLPPEQLDLKPQICHLDLQLGWDRSIQCADNKLHAFGLPDRYVVSFNN